MRTPQWFLDHLVGRSSIKRTRGSHKSVDTAEELFAESRPESPGATASSSGDNLDDAPPMPSSGASSAGLNGDMLSDEIMSIMAGHQPLFGAAPAPPPASPPPALPEWVPSPLPTSPWGISQPSFKGPPRRPPDPLVLTVVPRSPSSRLSCSSMPFLQRYGAADVLNANLQLPEQLEAAVPVTFGILGWQSIQPRPNLAPCPARSPPWTPKWCSGRSGRWPGSCLCSPLLPHRSILARRSMADVAGMPRASWGCA